MGWVNYLYRKRCYKKKQIFDCLGCGGSRNQKVSSSLFKQGFLQHQHYPLSAGGAGVGVSGSQLEGKTKGRTSESNPFQALALSPVVQGISEK